MLSILTDFADYRRARTNVVICAVAIFLTSSVSLASSKMSIFGLEVLISIPRLVGVLQVALVFLLSIFALYALGRAPRIVMREVYRMDRIWERKAKRDIEKMNIEMSGNSDPDFSPYDDYDGFYYYGMDVRRKRRATLFELGYFFDRFASIIVSLGVPITFSWLALYHPSFISKIVDEKIEEASWLSEAQLFCPSKELKLSEPLQLSCSPSE